MNGLRKISLLFTFNRTTLLYFAEALLYLGWARLLLFRKFSTVAPSLGLRSTETLRLLREGEAPVIKQVSSAINIVSRYTFWDSQCFVRAIAGMKMLQKRGIASTLYLGTGKDKNGKMIAHAWLRSGPLYITGAEEMKKFAVVDMFAQTAEADQRSKK